MSVLLSKNICDNERIGSHWGGCTGSTPGSATGFDTEIKSDPKIRFHTKNKPDPKIRFHTKIKSDPKIRFHSEVCIHSKFQIDF